jgi:hypothetical protein
MNDKFYNDDNLMEAGKSLPWCKHTKDEILEHFPELPIEETWKNAYLASISFDKVNDLFATGRITGDTWDAYQAIWRNSTYHYSNLAADFEF